MAARVLMIGLDGATFSVLDRLIKGGGLPNIAGLINEGARAEMLSTLPPLSPVAWTSLSTGKNPGKHGIYGFMRQKAGSYSGEIVNASFCRARPVWTILNEAGKKTGIFNVPFTYPPYKTEGFLISSGWDTDIGPGSVYPKALAREINDKFTLRSINMLAAKDALRHFLSYGNAEKILKNVERITEKRIEVFRYLAGRYRPDLLFIAFEELDIAQHFFWHCMDSRHPRHEEAGAYLCREVIHGLYKKIDHALGRLIKDAGEDTAIIVVSDHGMGPFDPGVCDLNLADWMVRNGFLSLSVRRGNNRPCAFYARKIFNLAAGAVFGFEKSRKIARALSSCRKKFAPDGRFSAVDWKRTRAYVSFEEGRSFWARVNLKGREPQGIVEQRDYEGVRKELISGLEELRHPVTAEKIIKKVHRRECLYSGDTLGLAPDLIIEWREQALFSEGPRCPENAGGIFKHGPYSMPLSGDHRREGIFIIKGRGINRGRPLEPVRIVDVAPTVLYLMGVPVPKDLDGRVLTEVFTDAFLSQNRLVYGEAGNIAEDAERAYSNRQKKEIEDKLRALGYLQ